ncbi:unnamed protein product [Effrenium voratum]|uniref:Uncharacterized protein n=1 Tax=Effrenium voratum TaxID=2562239 RepID=A0AA36MTD2_9DINO|nr:unnamed protein product [Effrenium voratum]
MALRCRLATFHCTCKLQYWATACSEDLATRCLTFWLVSAHGGWVTASSEGCETRWVVFWLIAVESTNGTLHGSQWRFVQPNFGWLGHCFQRRFAKRSVGGWATASSNASRRWLVIRLVSASGGWATAMFQDAMGGHVDSTAGALHGSE